jgi:hypothetical protein
VRIGKSGEGSLLRASATSPHPFQLLDCRFGCAYLAEKIGAMEKYASVFFMGGDERVKDAVEKPAGLASNRNSESFGHA